MRFVLFTLACLLLVPAQLLAGDLTIYTEEYPPYNTMAGGQLGGINTEKVVAMFEKAGVGIGRSDIKLVPWSRAYQSTLDNADSCVYSTTFTDERKDLFAWVGPLSTTESSIVGLKGKAQPVSDLKNLSGSVGTIQDDVGEQLALAQGLDASKMDSSSSSAAMLKKLYMGRVDYVAYEVNSLRDVAAKEGLDPNQLEPVYLLKEGQLFMACNKGTNAATIAKLQQALDSLK